MNPTAAIPTTQEAEALFQTLTVAKMREKRKEYNNGVEAKRQELRMLVGKRYAGLIEVADGISEMKTSSEGVTSSISELQSICHQLKKRQTTKINAQESEGKAVSDGSKQFYSITAQIKLLVSLPSRLYEALAQKNFSRASILLLLGTHVHQGLRLDTTAPDATQVFPFFPVISRMWPTIARFRPLIASASRAQLTSSSLSAEAAIDALTSLVALEGVTLRQVFADFLVARSEALNRVFASSGTASVKDQLTEGISILLLSLKLVYEVFSSSQPDGDTNPSSTLLCHLQSLTSSSSSELKSDVIGCCGATVGAALPASVIDFKPALRGKVAPLADDQIRERCEKWFEVSLSSLRSSLSSQLAYVTSVKGLAHIRDVTAEVLAKPEISTNWKEVSTAVLGREVCVWKEAVRPLTLERLESLLKRRLQASVSALIDDLKTHANRIDGDDDDVLDFMWSESSSDIPRVPFGDGAGPSPSDGAGNAPSTSKDPPSSQLRMKTKGRTPKLQAICRRLDEHLENVLEDARHFGVLKDAGSTVDLGEDVSHISSSLTRFAYEAFQHFFAFFDEELDKATEAVQLQHRNNNVNADALPVVLRLVFLGRVCEALTELSPHLFNALVPSAVLQFEDGAADGVAGGAKNSTFLTASTRSLLSFRRSLMTSSSSHRQSMTSSSIHSSASHHQDQSLFLDVKEDFMKRFWSTWEAWRRFALDDALSALSKRLVGDDFSALLSSNRLTAWETVEIKEDGEAEENGKEPMSAAPSSSALSTSIRVPVQATAGLHGVLHRLCRRINDVGGYIVPKTVVETLAEEFLRESASEFSKAAGFGEGGEDAEAPDSLKSSASAVPMNQTLAIQLAFDAKYLLQLLSHRGTTDKTKQKMESFVSALESFIDPFDLDLLNPHLQARVLRHAQRTNALFGLLTSSARATGKSGRGGASTITMVVANEKASTLMLCGGSSTLGSRFPTIPLPTPGGAAGGKDAAASLRRQMGAAASDHGSSSAAASAAARRKDDQKGDKSSSPMHKAATWSSGLSKLTAREGSNSPSDFFKSGAALYTSWFGGGGNNE